jgi:formate dehydrogenase alpha subunit
MSDQVTLTIDGRQATVAPGVTLYWAARSLGIEIPHLCYGEDVHPIGSCRMCVVEVEGMRNLAASCSHPVSPGMVVRTDTERVRAARRMNLQLILSDHTIECITCEKSGSCRLERYAYEFGIAQSRFGGPRHARNRHVVDRANPFFERDYNKCILCGRCVLACGELQMDSAIDYAGRGFGARISTAFGRPLAESTCEFCGRCISVCPVGALTEKARRGAGREWELEVTSTICPYCGVGCTLDLHVKAGRIVRSATRSRDTVNRGNLCVKGKFGISFVNHPDRLTTPLVRRDGKLAPASWEEALDVTARRLGEIRSAHGPEALGGLASAKCTNEENYLFQRFVRAVLGTNNVDHCARLCHASTVSGLARAFGSGAMTNTIAELRHADCIFVIGSNTTEAHPVIALEIKAAARKGAALVVADPRRIDLVRFAKVWLRHRSGTDVALLNGMMHVILEEGLENRQFIEKRTEDFEKFRAVVRAYPPEKAATITGVPREKIVEAARLYARASAGSIVYSMGITQHTTGTDNVLSLANLAMLTGQIGKRSSGVNPLRGQNNVQGACDMGALPNVYPGYQAVTNPEVREKFQGAWQAPALPAEPGLTVVEMLHAAGEGRIKGLYIMGENPFLSDPNANRVRLDLSRLEFLVVQDIFLSETASFAHVVLPAASFAEKDGTFTNTERRVQLLRPALPPPGDARPDWRILCDVATRMGSPLGYQGSAEIMDEMARLTPIYGGISHARIQHRGLQWPCPDPVHPGTPILHVGTFSRGKGLFSPVEYIPPAEEPDAEYPLLLTTGRILYHYHTGTMSRRVDSLDAHRPDGFVEINPEDARALGLAHGDVAEVASRRGTVKARCEVTRRARPGTVFMAFHFAEAAANILTNDALDPVAKIPEFKVCAVRIARV